MTLILASSRRAAVSACCSCSAVSASSSTFHAGAGHTALVASGASSPSSTSQPRRSADCRVAAAAAAFFSTSSQTQAKPRKARVSADAPMNIRKLPAFRGDDIPLLGHQILEYNREFLRMFRLVELELPKLAEFKQPFEAPDGIVKIRFVHHQGATHAENKKAVLTVDIGPLFSHPSSPLSSDAAKHKFLLLAGERFDSSAGLKDARDRVRVQLAKQSSKDADEVLPGHALYTAGANLTDEQEATLRKEWLGQVKIASDRFPNERMNATWCLDTLYKLIQEANQNPEAMASIPLDPRPQLAREAKAQTFARSHPVSLRDFPKEWL